MAFTQADIDALKMAIASGVLRVQYTDREVTYQTIPDMLQALSVMTPEVQGANATRHRFVRTKKGL